MNKQQLEAYVKEVAGDDPDIATKLLEVFGSKPDAAERFSGGFLRRDDYTKKTQELAKTKEQTDRLLTDYNGKLEQAEVRMKQIMKDAAKNEIDAATANARLQHIKKAYALSDEDIPTVADVQDAVNTGKVKRGVVEVDIEARLGEFEKSLMKSITDKLIPQLSGMAALPIVWNSIQLDHQELTGKRLTKAEQADILAEAQKDGKRSIEQVWEDKYKVGELREKKSDEGKRSKWKEEWDKEQTAKRSEEVLSGGVKRNGIEIVDESQRSPLLRKQFKTHPVDPIEPDTRRQTDKQTDKKVDPPEPRLSGADRAQARFLERRAKGLALGEVEVKKAS